MASPAARSVPHLAKADASLTRRSGCIGQLLLCRFDLVESLGQISEETTAELLNPFHGLLDLGRHSPNLSGAVSVSTNQTEPVLRTSLRFARADGLRDTR